MPVSPTYPGVYVQEVPSGVHTIVGVSTSVALFVGRTATGPMMRAVALTTYTDFVRTFGDDGGAVSQMARYVRLFFMNGGTTCYVIRVAYGAAASKVQLQPELGGAAVLALTAKNPGLGGDLVRVAVDYNTASPEATFNVTVFRWDMSTGTPARADQEQFLNLTMAPTAPNYAVTQLSQKSKLIDAAPLGAPAPKPGLSLSNPIVASTGADLATAVVGKSFQLALADKPPVTITVTGPATGTLSVVRGGLTTNVQQGIADAIAAAGITGLATPPAKFEALQGPASAGPDGTTLFRITAGGNYDVRILSAPANDLATAIGWGAANNGIEIGSYAASRPAPTGIVMLSDAQLAGAIPPTAPWFAFASTKQNAFAGVTLEELDASGTPVPKIFGLTSATADTIAETGVLRALNDLATQINSYAASNPTTFPWKASLWGQRLAIARTVGADNAITTVALPAAMTSLFLPNVRAYSLGTGGTPVRQSGGVAGKDGDSPKQGDYNDAYAIAQRDIDLFNLMVLPPDNGPTPTPLEQLWGDASAVCAAERAFLLMDPPDAWTDVQTAATGVNALRPGLTKDYAALYFPRLTMAENGRQVTVGPAGAMAGIYARTDSTRGVWKAPAGIEADVRGVNGVDLNMSDLQNGLINPVGINAVRLFPNGIVGWGARTMDGADAFASEYKYVPIRRLALFIEESLYRGLKWAVFEPNDEPLWASIRLNVGSFMNDLFRKGAFQGSTPSDAYFVKCDKETTTAADRNLGIVNIWVGFAPLKPAEFVVLYLQQIAQAQPS